MATASERISAFGGNRGDRSTCPVCSARRGLAVDQRNGKLLVHCHANNCDVVSYMKQHGTWPGGTGGWRIAPERRDDRSPAEAIYERLRSALSILRTAAWADAGQPRAYLEARGIEICPDSAMLLPAKDSRRLLNRGYPAMVFPVTGAEGLQGAHVTWLNLTGVAKLGGTDTPRKSYGKIGGGYVKFGEIDPDRPLLVGEGIETVLSAMQIADLPGIATLSTSGMKAVNLPACSEVIIVADNDPPGREAANILAERIGGRRPVRIAAPPKTAGDWNDALRSPSCDLTELKRRIVKAPKRHARPRLHALTAEEFVALDIPPVRHFLAPILPVSGATVFSGPKGNGKTRVVLSIAETIATGGAMLDWESQRSGRVLYIDGELAEGLVKKRLERLQPTDERLFVVSRYHQKNAGVKMTKLTDPTLRDEIDRLIEECEIDVIILDSFSSLVGESENDMDYWPAIED